MSAKYRHGHRAAKKHHFWVILLSVFLVIGTSAFFIKKDLENNKDNSVVGVSRVVGQVVGEDTQGFSIDEPYFSMRLPKDWKELRRTNSPSEQSIEWYSTAKGKEGRSLKIYVDIIPLELAVNRLLPVSAQGETISTGEVSDNCAAFTGGTAKAEKKPTALARWSGVDFLCNIEDFANNKVGTSSTGGINQVSVTGPVKGTHKYFFLFTDHNIQADNSILQNAIQSFRAK